MHDRYLRNAAVEAAPMKDETVLFNPANNKFCVLNLTAAFIWDMLQKPQSEQDIAVALVRHFAKIESTVAQRDVQLTLAQLRDIGCVERI